MIETVYTIIHREPGLVNRITNYIQVKMVNIILQQEVTVSRLLLGGILILTGRLAALRALPIKMQLLIMDYPVVFIMEVFIIIFINFS